MNNFLKKILTSALAAATAVSGMSFAASAEPDESFTDLSAAEITDAMGVGWNVGNQLEASSNGTPNETAWQSTKITKELIDAVKAQGFNSVRIPVSYLSMIGDGSDYTIDEAWLNRVQEVVDYVVENDMYAIINIHGDGYYTVDGGWLLVGEEDQEGINEKFGAVWTQIAEKFKDYDEHLIFESMNEVFDGGYDDPTAEQYAQINAYNQTFVDAVRATGGNNAMRWLLIPGWNTDINYTVGDYGFEIPSDDSCTADGNRIMISVHYYDPWDFCGNESNHVRTQWGAEADAQRRGGVESDVETAFTQLYDAFVSKGYPVVIGELGCIDKSYVDELNTESRARWLSCVVSTARELGCIPVYWDNGWNGDNGFGLFNRATYEVTQPELVAAIAEAAQTPYNPPADDSSSEPSNESTSDSSIADSSSDTDSSASSAADSSADSNTVTSTTTSSTASSAASTSSSDKSPATGNSNAIAMSAALILIAGAGLAAAKSKKK